MNRLTKRNANGVAYMVIADSLPKSEQEIEGSKPILEGLYAMFQRLAEYEDLEEQGRLVKLPANLCKGETLLKIQKNVLEKHSTFIDYGSLHAVLEEAEKALKESEGK